MDKMKEAETIYKNKLEEEKDELRQEITNLKDQIVILNNLKIENLSLKQKIDHYDNELQQNSNGNNNNNIFDYQMNAVKSENESLQKEVEELKLKLDDLSDENTSLKINLHELNSTKDLNDKIKNLNKQLEVISFLSTVYIQLKTDV